MERKPDRQNQIQSWKLPRDVQELQNLTEVLAKEIVVFENREKRHVGDNAYKQEKLSLAAGRTFNFTRGYIVDDYYQKENSDVDRYPRHVEQTTGKKEQQPTPAVREYEIQSSYYRKKQ
jgi:hypothetical protein